MEIPWNSGMRLLSGCQYHTNFSRSLDIFKSIRLSFFNRAIQNHVFFIIKQRVFIFIQLFMQFIYFCLLYSIIWLKEGRIQYFESSWKFYNRSWNYYGKIMEFYFVFSVGILPWASGYFTPIATSFRRMFFLYHHTMKHHHTNIIVSLLYPQLWRSWWGILLLTCPFVRACITLFYASCNLEPC